jgi:hypothetical protein
MQDDSEAPPGGDFDIPDLDLELPAPAPAGSAAIARAQRAASVESEDVFDSLASGVVLGKGKAEDAFGGGFDASHFDSGAVVEPQLPGTSLEDFDADLPVGSLDLQSYRPPPPPAPPPRAPSAAPVLTAPAAPHFDPIQIEDTAGYGPAPTSLLATPAYAVRVTLRKRALRAELPASDAKLRDAESRRERFLAELARARLPAVEGDERYGGHLAKVRAAAGRVQQGTQAQGDVQSLMAQIGERFRAQTQELEQALGTAQAAEQELSNERRDAETALQRVQAKQKRFLIEARAVVTAATGGRPEVAVPPDVHARVANLQSQAAACEQEALAARQSYDGAQQRLQQAAAEHQARRHALQSVQQQEAAQKAQLQSQLSSQQAATGDASAQMQHALAELALALLATRALPMDEETASQLSAAESYVERCSADHALAVRALDAADMDAVQRGFLLMGATALALIVLLLLLLR